MPIDVASWLLGELGLRVRANGAPATGADVLFWIGYDPDSPKARVFAQLDADRRAAVGTFPPVALTVWIWPRELADEATRRSVSKQPGDLDARRLHFEPIRVAPGRQVVELVAPEGSGY